MRGDGDTDKQGGKKLLRFTTDYVEATQITVRVFYDHECKNNFYISRLQERCAPRMWLPDNLPRAIYAEWTSERFVESEGKWVHPEGAAPNDYGDCAKQTEIFWEEESANIRLMDSKAPVPG